MALKRLETSTLISKGDLLRLGEIRILAGRLITLKGLYLRISGTLGGLHNNLVSPRKSFKRIELSAIKGILRTCLAQFGYLRDPKEGRPLKGRKGLGRGKFSAAKKRSAKGRGRKGLQRKEPSSPRKRVIINSHAYRKCKRLERRKRFLHQIRAEDGDLTPTTKPYSVGRSEKRKKGGLISPERKKAEHLKQRFPL